MPDDKRIEFYAYERMPGGQEDKDELAALSAKLKSDDDVKQYYHMQGKPLEHCGTQGCTSVEVLHFLKGLKLTNLVLAYVYGLHPSLIRVSTGVWTCDAYTDRVSITVDEDDVVQKIEQEMSVGYGCGYDVDQCLAEARSGRVPRASSGCIGHTSGLARIDFT